MNTRPFLAVGIAVLIAALTNADVKRSSKSLIGRKIKGFSAQDYRGKEHSLKSLGEGKLVAVCFMGTECPLAKIYGPELQSIQEEFSDDLTVVGIDSNIQDSLTEISAFALRHKLNFPILKDLGAKIADLMGASRTPEVFLLDRNGTVRYHGRVDGRYTFGSGVGQAAPRQKRRDLVEAIQELRDGKDVSVAETEVKGCIIGRRRKRGADTSVTYSKHISRIMQRHCIECHRDGQIAPFALGDYDSVAAWGEMIAEVVEERRMPPWHADPKIGHFKNAAELSAVEREQIQKWVTNGCPQGDSQHLPKPRKFQEGWFTAGGPERVVAMTEKPYEVKASGVEPYRYFEVDPGFKEDTYVRVAECMPGNRDVVHHIIVWLKPPGTDKIEPGTPSHKLRKRGFRFFVGYAPGTRPLPLPKGWARLIPAGYTFAFELHYTPVGSKQTDISKVGFVTIKESEVTHIVRTGNAVNARLNIPPHESDAKAKAEKTFREDGVLLSLYPHMHLRGKAFRYELVEPGKDAKPRPLLNVPRYDFNWQNHYILQEPIQVKKGTKLRCYAVFDNSEDNLANPDPTQRVRWGDQTFEEMMIGWYDIAIPRKVAERTKAQSFPQREKK